MKPTDANEVLSYLFTNRDENGFSGFDLAVNQAAAVPGSPIKPVPGIPPAAPPRALRSPP